MHIFKLYHICETIHLHSSEQMNEPTAKAFNILMIWSGGQLQLITLLDEMMKKDLMLNHFRFCSYYWHICAESCVGVSEEPTVRCACAVKCNVKKNLALHNVTLPHLKLPYTVSNRMRFMLYWLK